MPSQPICHPAQVPVTNRKAPLHSQLVARHSFKEDTGEPSVSAQEISPVTYLPDRCPNQDLNPTVLPLSRQVL